MKFRPDMKVHFVGTNDGWEGLYIDGKFISSRDTSSIYYWLDELGIEYTQSGEEDHPEAAEYLEDGSLLGFNFEDVKLEDN